MWRLLVGKPHATDMLSHQRLTKIKGLAVFSADPLSSSAYATEEILRVLMLAGAAGMALTLPISLAIVSLLIIVGISYFQTIHAYPSGGGAYIVARENIGLRAGLIAAAALLVDYVLTVAVSVSAGVAAITSALPALYPFRLEVALACIAFMTIVNLRGVKESGAFFSVPAYLFIAVFGGMILFGLFQFARGRLPVVLQSAEAMAGPVRSMTLLLFFRAFASGCAALTGVEAVSNGVPAFYPQESRNASRVLIWMVAILGAFFLGVSFLARHMRIVPAETETVISLVARNLFGVGPYYYLVQGVTMMILVLAANTAYADFPRLASILAHDSHLPRQLGNLGDRLVFANGILSLGAICSILVVIFHADTHSLIPLYMIGVFISFTLSQAGMVIHWRRVREEGWKWKTGVNGFGATFTAIVGLVVGVAKFTEGAWITIFTIGIFVIIMRAIHAHYESLNKQLSLDGEAAPEPFSRHIVVMPVSSIHRGTLEAVRYARALGGEIIAAYVEIDASRTDSFKATWEKHFPGVELKILASPYRSVIGPLLLFMDQLQREAGMETALTVVIPQFIPKRLWHHALHNQTAFLLKIALLYRRTKTRRYKVVSDVPFYLRH